MIDDILFIGIDINRVYHKNVYVLCTWFTIIVIIDHIRYIMNVF